MSRPLPIPGAGRASVGLATRALAAAALLALAQPLAAQPAQPVWAAWPTLSSLPNLPNLPTLGELNALLGAAPPLALPAAVPPPAEPAESLGALLARVLPRDPQVQVAHALLMAAQERQRQARSRLGPSLQLTVSNGQADQAEFGQALQRRTDRAEAGLRWNLYNGGNDHAELAATGRDIAAAEQDLRRAREEVGERIAEPYLELLRLQSLLPHAAERLAEVRRLVAQAQRQADAGKASDADALQAGASLLDAEMQHEQLLADQDSARAKLAALAGSAVGELRGVLPLPLAAVADAQLAAGTPGLLAASQARALAARDRVRPPLSLLAPRIDLEYRRRLSDQTLPVLTTTEKQTWLLTARWDLPVMGENQARRNEAQRRAEAAEADAQRVARGLQAEQLSLQARVLGAERALAQLERQIQQYQALQRAGELQFEAGRRNLGQLIALRDSRFNAEQRRADQAHRLLSARLRQLALAGLLLPALGLGGDIPAH